MTVHSLCCLAAASIVAMSAFASSAAAAPACEKGRCETTAQASTGNPLKLKNFAKKPAAAPASRTVKKKKNARSRTARQARPEPVETDAVKSDSVRQTTGSAVPASTQLPPEAAQAFASYELARVRVVTPEDIDSAQLLSSTALAENPGDLAADEATTIVSHNAVPPVGAEDINASDRQVDPPVAVSLDTLSRDLAGNAPTPSGSESWFSRLLVLLGSAFTAVAAVVRTFFA